MYYPDPYGAPQYPGAYPPAVPSYPSPSFSSPYPSAYPAPSPYPSPAPYSAPPSTSSSLYPSYPHDSSFPSPAPSYLQPYAPSQPSSYPHANKRALLVGCNYTGNPQAKLNGCVNDAMYLKFLLTSKLGFQEQNMLVLTDENPNPVMRPTKANLLNGINWLVAGTQPGDSLFFSFSGHGGQTKDFDGDEEDGMDETILPLDYKTAGSIVDDDLHRMLAMAIPYGAKLTCIMDCCHSGTGLDLPFVYSNGTMSSGHHAYRKTTQGDVVLFSSCLDHQLAADSKNLSRVAFSGVLTFSFCQSMESSQFLTHASLLQTMQRFSAAKGFSQVIQLSSGKQMDLNSPFSI